MNYLNEQEIAQVAGGLLEGSENNTTNLALKGAAAGLIIGLAVCGTQRILIDALSPFCTSIVPVNSFSSFIGSNFGTAEHFSHVITMLPSMAVVAGATAVALS